MIELWEADESRMPPAVFYELDLSTKPPKLVENPSRCQMCHGNPPFARWDSIPFWPGTVSKDERSMGQELVNRNDPFYALFDWENYDSVGSGPYYMGRALAPYQRLVMADRLKRDPQFDSYKYAYLGAMGFCDSIEMFLPPELRRDHLHKLKKQFGLSAESMTALHEDTMLVMNAEKESRAKRYQRSVETFQTKYGKAPEKSLRLSYKIKDAEAESVTSMRFLVEGKGISMSDWSNTNYGKSGHRSYDYGVESDMGGVRAIACLLVPEIIKEPEMRELLANRISFDDNRMFEKEHKAAICQKLREKSLAALASLTGTGPAPVQNAVKSVHGVIKGHAPNPK